MTATPGEAGRVLRWTAAGLIAGALLGVVAAAALDRHTPLVRPVELAAAMGFTAFFAVRQVGLERMRLRDAVLLGALIGLGALGLSLGIRHLFL